MTDKVRYRRNPNDCDKWQTCVPRDQTVIYLASPYLHKDITVRLDRFKKVCEAAAELMKDGYVVFSPIAHSHPIATHGDINPTNNEFWLEQDKALMPICTEMIVLQLPGWEDSKGIKEEILFAEELGIEVYYLKQEDL